VNARSGVGSRVEISGHVQAIAAAPLAEAVAVVSTGEAGDHVVEVTGPVSEEYGELTIAAKDLKRLDP